MTMDPRWATARKILAIRLDSIGDVLMTTPAIRALKEAPSRPQITLLTSLSGAAIARLVPEIDHVIAYDAPWIKAGKPRPPGSDLGLIARLGGERFDAAVIFTCYSQNPLPAAMLAYLAGIPQILAHCRERAYRLLSNAVPETEPETGIRHEVRRQLDLAAAVGFTPSSERLSLTVPPTALASMAKLIAIRQLEGRWAIVHPGATAPSRRAPPTLFADAMRNLAGDHGWRFVIIGDDSERSVADEVTSLAGACALNLAGQLRLPELVALIARAPLLIANNSGPAHIAAALQTPVVDLYALTNPQHGPWMTPSVVLNADVSCRWCLKSVCPEGHHRCLEDIAPAEVVEAALTLTEAPEAVPA